MIYVLLVFGIFIADLKIKKYIETTKEMHKKEEILKGNIIIERYHNKGAALNFMENNIKIVKIVAVTLLGVVLLFFGALLPKKGHHLMKFAMSLIVGGALSNVYDRFTKGYVVDYFSFKWLKKIVFNISDICIFIGAGLVGLISLFSDDN